MFNKIQIKRHKFLIILIFYIIMIFDNNKLNFGMANYIESSSSSIVMNDSNSNNNNNNTTSNRTVKKQLNDTNISLSDNFNKNNNKGASNNKDKNNLSLNQSVQIASNTLMPTIAAAKVQLTTASTLTNDSNTSHTKNMKNIQDFDIPNSFRVGFYIFIGLGVVAVIFISYRSYRLKLSRAERRYGVQGDRRAQELIPLPISIEDESDTEDHTLFDIHKQIRIS